MKQTTNGNDNNGAEIGTESIEHEIRHAAETALTTDEIKEAKAATPPRTDVFDIQENDEWIGLYSDVLDETRLERVLNDFEAVDVDVDTIEEIINDVSKEARNELGLGHQQPVPFVAVRKHADEHDVDFDEFVDELGEYADYARPRVLAELLSNLRTGHERVKEYDDAYTVHEQDGCRSYYIEDWSVWTDDLDEILDVAGVDVPGEMSVSCLLAYVRVTQDKHAVGDVADTTLVDVV